MLTNAMHKQIDVEPHGLFSMIYSLTNKDAWVKE